MGSRSRRRHRSRIMGEPNGLQPGDDIGNRKSHKAQHIPPDDIGNRAEPSEAQRELADEIGNRIELPPTHVKSGLLDGLDPRRRRKNRSGGELVRMGRYFVGGVHPLVSGNQAYMARYDAEMRLEAEAEQKARPPQFDFQIERRPYTLKSSLEDKKAQAIAAAAQVLALGELKADVMCETYTLRGTQRLVLCLDEAAPVAANTDARSADAAERGADVPASTEVAPHTPVFAHKTPAMSALTYVLNKIVNRFPDDRVHLTVIEARHKDAFTDALAAFEQAADERAARAEAAEAAREPNAGDVGPAVDPSEAVAPPATGDTPTAGTPAAPERAAAGTTESVPDSPSPTVEAAPRSEGSPRRRRRRRRADVTPETPPEGGPE